MGHKSGRASSAPRDRVFDVKGKKSAKKKVLSRAQGVARAGRKGALLGFEFVAVEDGEKKR